MTRAHRAVGIPIALSLLLFVAASARATTYRNDGFEDGAEAGFQAGFVSGEIGAACFHPPVEDYPLRLNSVQLLFGGSNPGATMFANLKVWRAGGDGVAPNDLIVDIVDLEFTSSTTAFSEVDLISYGITVTQPWCVGLEMTRDGLPSIARDNDGNIDALNNWIYADGFGWVQSNLLGLVGDWVIRTIATSGTVVTDTGVADTGTADTGTPDTGTPDTGAPDTGPPDTGTPDTGPADTGSPEVDAVADATAAVRIDDVTQDGEDPSVDVEVTLTGTGFEAAYRYRVGVRTLTDIQVFDGTEVTGVLPANALEPGTYDVSVRGDFGEALYSSGVLLRDLDSEAPAPIVNRVTPDETTFGLSVDIVVIGSNFLEGAIVLVDGRPLPGEATVTNDETLLSFVPGDHVDMGGDYDLVVRNPDGQSSAPMQFTFIPYAAGSSDGCGCSSSPSPAEAGLLGLALLGLAALRRR